FVREGTWGAEFFPLLAPLLGHKREFIVKHSRINAFFGSPLEEILRALGASRLLVAGVSTHLAVESTVRHAVDMGFEVHIVANACSGSDPAVHRASLLNMSLLGDVLEPEDLDKRYPPTGPDLKESGNSGRA